MFVNYLFSMFLFEIRFGVIYMLVQVYLFEIEHSWR